MTEESDDFRRTLAAVLEGDAGALASLFSVYRDRLKRMVELRLDARLRGRVSASDVLQEAYIDALQRLPHYQADPGMPIFVWLRWVTMQRLVEVHRQHLGGQIRDAGREVRLGEVDAMGQLGQIAEFFVDTTSPSQAAQRAETMAQVREALDALDPIDREVLALRHFEELSNQEDRRRARDPARRRQQAIRARALERLKSVLEQVPGFEGGAT